MIAKKRPSNGAAALQVLALGGAVVFAFCICSISSIAAEGSRTEAAIERCLDPLPKPTLNLP